MGLRVKAAWLALCGSCVLQSVAVAQAPQTDAAQAGFSMGASADTSSASADATARTDAPSDDLDQASGAMMPPEVAFADDTALNDAVDDGGSSDDASALDARGFYDRYRRFNSALGPTGGYHLIDPTTGMPGSFRIQLATDFFSSSDYLIDGDEVDVTEHALSLSWSATELLEVFASLSSRAASFEIAEEREVGTNVSQSLQATGDIGFGLKAGAWLGDGPFSLGGSARVMLFSGEAKASPELAATGLALGMNAALDLRRQADPVPFIARFNLGYTIDNTAKLAEAREAARYPQVNDPRPMADETRHLANRFERLAFGMNRVDVLGVGLGVELPLFVARDFYLHPLIEWQWGIPINRQAYDCAHLALTDVGTADRPEDSCLKDEGLSASPMSLSLGLRVVTPLRGFSAFAGVDIGLLGASTFVRELSPNAPYAVLLGLAVDYDARPAPVEIVEREVVVQAPVETPKVGRVRVTVANADDGTGVAGASVSFVGREQTVMRTDDAGALTSFELPPGAVRLHVSHPDYAPGECVAAIGADGGDVDARCAIAALPRKGTFKLRVTDAWGAPVIGASVQLQGPVVASFNTGSDGAAQRDDLAAGQYVVHVDAPNHYLRVSRVEIVARQVASAALTITPRPGPSRAELRGTEIRLSGSVRFARGAATVDAALAPVFADLADLLLRNPQVTRVRIEAPADAGGDAMLGLSRALAIKQRLVDAGVESDRINAIASETPRLRVVVE